MPQTIEISYPEGTNNKVLVELVATGTVKYVGKVITQPANAGDPIIIACSYTTVSGGGEDTGENFDVQVDPESGDTLLFTFQLGSELPTSLSHPFPPSGGKMKHIYT